MSSSQSVKIKHGAEPLKVGIPIVSDPKDTEMETSRMS